ncbi:MAG: ATP-binding protein [Chitinophagales bacterium]|nr:ATP-binding protein [Chitinophagales bacterium]
MLRAKGIPETKYTSYKLPFSEVLHNIEKAKEERQKHSYKCVDYAARAVAIAQEHNMYFQAAEAKLEIVLYYINSLKDYQQALPHAREALHMLGSENYTFLKANILKLIGVCYHFTGDFVNAIIHYQEAAKILEKENVHTIEECMLAGSLHFNVMLIYRHLPFDEDRFKHITRAIFYYERANYYEGIAKCYALMADCHPQIKNDPLQKRQYYQKAIEIFRYIGNKSGEITCYSRLGLVYCELGDEQTGMEWLNKGFLAAAETKTPDMIANAHDYFAKAYRILKQYDNAIAHFRLVEDLLIKNRREAELVFLYEEMASTLAESGDYASAYQYRQKYTRAKQEWLNFDKLTSVHNATMKLELEKHEQETFAESKKGEQINYYVRQLKISNDELKQIAYVAAHDLREPLRMIISYTSLLSEHPLVRNNPIAYEYCGLIENYSKKVYEMVHELMKPILNQRKVSLKRVRLNDLIEKIRLDFVASIFPKSVEIKWENLPEMVTDPNLLYQLFQNLFSNAVKYNVSDRPVIEIRYRFWNNKHHFEVHDNGIGIPVTEREKAFYMFSRLHRDFRANGSGKGLSVCRRNINLLKGKIWIEDSDLGGVCVRFYIPED